MLAVALPKPGEDAEDLGVPLRAQRVIMVAEPGGILHRRRLQIAREHLLLELRRDVAPRVLEQRDEVVGGMARQRVLEIEQAELARAGQDHQIVGVIVAQDEDWRAQSLVHCLPPRLPPRREVGAFVHLQPERRHVPFGKQRHLASLGGIVIGRQVAWRGVAREPGEGVDRRLVDAPLALRLLHEQGRHPPVPEILEQEQTLLPVHGKRARRQEAPVEQMAGDGEERPDILMLGRRVHQHSGAPVLHHPEVAAEARVARQRQDLRAFPSICCKEIGRRRGRNHRGGHRASQAAGTFAVKARAPSPWRERVSRSA